MAELPPGVRKLSAADDHARKAGWLANSAMAGGVVTEERAARAQVASAHALTAMALTSIELLALDRETFAFMKAMEGVREEPEELGR